MTTNLSGNLFKYLDPFDEKWFSYIDTKDQANIFHHPAWIKTLTESYNYRPFVAVVVDHTDNIQAGIPFVEVNSPLTGRRWVSLSFTDHIAPLFDSQPALDALLQELIKTQTAGSVPKLEIRWEVKGEQKNWFHTRQVLHRIPLENTAKNVAKNFHKMHQRNIKTAKKRGVKIQHGTSREFLEAFYEMHLETRKRHGIPIQPKKFFVRLHENLIQKGLGFISLAFVEEEYIASAIFLHYKKTLIYKYGASKVSGQNYRPNNLIFWRAIEWGIENGYTALDLGKTEQKNTGLRNFKDGWGAQESELAYSILSDSPAKNGNSFLQTSMEKIITLSPKWVCRATGEILYKHFG